MQNYTDEIIAKFPNLTCSVLNGGVNVYYHKYVITIWWKKQSYCDTAKHKWVRFTSLEAIIKVIEAASMPKQKKVAVIEAQVPIMTTQQLLKKMDETPWLLVSNNRVQEVIDHIQRKIEYGIANGLNPSNIAMLNNLKEELRQYL